MDFNIKDFIDELPVSGTRERTFLEIIKASHRETIMANLLAYYFKPDEEHGLGDTFIKALLQAQPYELAEHSSCGLPSEIQKYKDSDFRIDRAEVLIEDPTNDQKRIDIIIETDDIVIGIEFKIGHKLNNPLDTYVQHVTDKYPGKPAYFLVLTPFWKKPEPECQKNKEFSQVMLSHFMEQVESLRKTVEGFDDKTNPQYHFFQDLVRTIENRKIKFNMIKNYQDKAKEDEEFAEKLNQVFDDLQQIQQELEKKMKEVQAGLPDFQVIGSSTNKLYSVIEKKKNDDRIKLRLTLQGWSIESWKAGKLEKKHSQTREDYHTEPQAVLGKVREFEAAEWFQETY